MRNFVWPVFSCIRREYGDLQFESEYRKYGPEKNPYSDTFHAVLLQLHPRSGNITFDFMVRELARDGVCFHRS